MKENVIDFLGNTPKSGSEAFNRALELYRKSKGNSPEQVRYMNTTGYSPERLEILKYELKKLHSITDLEVAKARRKEVNKSEKKKIPTEAVKWVKSLLDFDLENSSEEEISTNAEMIRQILGIEENPVDENNEFVSDIEFVTAVRGYFEAHQALDEDPEKTLQDLLEITAESKKEFSDEKDPRIGFLPGKEIIKDLLLNNQEKTDSGENAVDLTNNGPEDLEPQKSDEVPTEQATHEQSPEEVDEQAKGAAEAREKFLKEDLTEFDVEASKYNDIKSFAAELSDYINEDPKDQKGDTLKAFILEAKKKFPAN